MEIKGDLFVLQHSETQKSFVVEKLSDMVMNNMNCFVRARPVDYIVVAIADTEEELNQQKEKLIKLRGKNCKV
ncbi:hypothetical protein CRN79_24580 [Serratia fonticola]|uniref:hypothetical protein n=1 Tax=Serratia fonticola TaxID=47917 RepID=UPI000BFE2D4F|nr:hypothetical protein [Serratia fonticola]ATM78809.1 hypothetical protein CRN79_24580 [Serratia fonticola]